MRLGGKRNAEGGEGKGGERGESRSWEGAGGPERRGGRGGEGKAERLEAPFVLSAFVSAPFVLSAFVLGASGESVGQSV